MTQFMTAAPPEAVRVMPDGRKVTAIPARMQACAAVPLQPVRKPRVVAYARVSTDQEEQETSFEAQCDYYGSLIRNIRLGPTLPAFVSPGVLNHLVESFGIAPISTPENDLKELLP